MGSNGLARIWLHAWEDDLIFTSFVAAAERFRLRLDLVVKLN